MWIKKSSRRKKEEEQEDPVENSKRWIKTFTHRTREGVRAEQKQLEEREE